MHSFLCIGEGELLNLN